MVHKVYKHVLPHGTHFYHAQISWTKGNSEKLKVHQSIGEQVVISIDQ